MNSNLKKALGLLLMAGALVGCISVLAYVGGNSGNDSNDSDNTTGGSAFRFKPLEYLENIFNNTKSNAYSNTGTYDLKVNTDNVNNYTKSVDFVKIADVINTGAQGLASENNYSLKYFDIYSTRRTAKQKEDDPIYSITFRFRYKVECSKSNEQFEYYIYTSNTATKTKGYKANVSITGLDVDLIVDSSSNSFVDILDYTFNNDETKVDIHNESFKLSTISFDDNDYGSSYFILENGSAIKLTNMYNDPIERLSHFEKDIYPDMCYKAFFTTKSVEEITPDNPLINKPSYEKDTYTNREKNILRFIHGDLDRCVGGFYDMEFNGKTPVLSLVKGKDRNDITKYNNKAALIYRGKFEVTVEGKKSTVELLMEVSLHNLDKLDEASDDGDIIQSVRLFELKDGIYKMMLGAVDTEIVYFNNYSNSSFVAYDMVINSNIKEEVYLVDKYYSAISGLDNNYPEIKFDKHDFDENVYISVQPDGKNDLVLKQLYDNCDELDEIMSLFVSLC